MHRLIDRRSSEYNGTAHNCPALDEFQAYLTLDLITFVNSRNKLRDCFLDTLVFENELSTHTMSGEIFLNIILWSSPVPLL